MRYPSRDRHEKSFKANQTAATQHDLHEIMLALHEIPVVFHEIPVNDQEILPETTLLLAFNTFCITNMTNHFFVSSEDIAKA